jgi:hypothetical protein
VPAKNESRREKMRAKSGRATVEEAGGGRDGLEQWSEAFVIVIRCDVYEIWWWEGI